VHLVPQLLREVESTQIEARGEDIYGKNFLVRISKLNEKTRKSRLGRIQKALATALPQFKELSSELDGAGKPHLQMKLKHWRPESGVQTEAQFSDGTIRLLGLLWTLLDTDDVFLFEEPELSLNDRIVAQIPGLVHKLQTGKGRQVMMTTHSFSLLADSGIDPSEVIVLAPDKEGTSARLASDYPSVLEGLQAGLNIAELVLPLVDPQDIHSLSDC
jgi:predicted ATPase